MTETERMKAIDSYAQAALTGLLANGFYSAAARENFPKLIFEIAHKCMEGRSRAFFDSKFSGDA